MARAVVLLFVALVCAEWQDSSWTNTGSKGLGGVLYLCFRGDQASGMYSEYGVIQGTKSGDEISGFWYEAGGPTTNCFYGTFMWTLSSDGDFFEGHWTCAGSSTRFEWNESLVGDDSTVDQVKCGVLADEGSITGSWQRDGQQYDLCTENTLYYGSYEINTDGIVSLGKENGALFLDNRIGSGFYEEKGAIGVSLHLRLLDGRLANLWWATAADGEPNPEDNSDPLRHNFDLYDLQGEASVSECRANEDVEYEEPYLIYFEESPAPVHQVAIVIAVCMAVLLW